MAKVRKKVWAASAAMGQAPAATGRGAAAAKAGGAGGRVGTSCPDVRTMLRTAVSAAEAVSSGSKSLGSTAADDCPLEHSPATGMFPPVRGAAADDSEAAAAAGPSGGAPAGAAAWESSVPQLPTMSSVKYQAVAARRAAAQRASTLRHSTGRIQKRGKAGTGGAAGLTSPKARPAAKKTSRSKEWAEMRKRVAEEDAARRDGYAHDCFSRDAVLGFHTQGPCTSGLSPGRSNRYNLRRSVG